MTSDKIQDSGQPPFWNNFRSVSVTDWDIQPNFAQRNTEVSQIPTVDGRDIKNVQIINKIATARWRFEMSSPNWYVDRHIGAPELLLATKINTAT